MTEVYAGLDVSDKLTHVCVVDGTGAVLWAGACATDPDVIARTLKTRTPKRGAKGLARVVLETGSLSAFLYHGLVERGVPAICVCARHAKGVLSARVNKSDPHDAEGLAQMARTGWFKQGELRRHHTHPHSPSYATSAVRCGAGPGRPLASRRPWIRSSPSMKAVLPNGRPVVSAALRAALASGVSPSKRKAARSER